MILCHFAPILGVTRQTVCHFAMSLMWLTDLRLVQIIAYMNNRGSTKIRHSLLS